MNKEAFKGKLKYGTCVSDYCGRNGTGNVGTEAHECPYNSDVHNDSEFQCNCCEDCTNECAMDI